MIKVLIISYNALPLDVVSSYRAKAYCDHLFDNGIFPTLLTHNWEMKKGEIATHGPNDKPLYEHYSKYSVIRIPYPGRVKSQNQAQTLINYVLGNFDVELMPSYTAFKHFLLNHLQENRYDFILSIFNPHFHLKLAFECWKKFKIPYVLDFRDLWNNEVITNGYKPSFKQKLLDRLIVRRWQKWIDKSLFFCTPSPQWTLYLSSLTNKKGLVVRNGYEDDLKYLSHVDKAGKTFKLVHFGRIYFEQNIDPIIDGFKAFAKKFPNEDVRLEVVGLKPVNGINYEIYLRERLGAYVSFLPYMPKTILLEYCAKEASMFFFPNFREDNGQFPVKLYDYILLRKCIVVAPTGGEIEHVVKQTGSGVVLQTAEEVAEYLSGAYQRFRSDGMVSVESDESLVSHYSRKNQVRILAEQLQKEFSHGHK